MISSVFHDLDNKHTEGGTGRQGMLTPTWHLIPPLFFFRSPCCSAMYFYFALIIFEMVCGLLFSGTNLVNICISCIAQHKFRNRCKNISAFCRNLKSNTEKMLGNITKHNFVWRLLIYVRYYFILKKIILKNNKDASAVDLK